MADLDLAQILKFLARKRGTMLFLSKERERLAAAEEALVLTREMLADSEKVADAMFLALYIRAAQVGTWLGADAWPASFLSKASVPGMKCREAAQAMLAGIESSVVNKNETSEIVDAYVTATWGDEASYTSDSFDGVMISTPPQQASVQYSIGMLWGYAIRGVAKRLALDRQLGTVPELVSAQRLQLERALDLNFNESSNGPPTFLQYASEFFSHEDWADLCRPSNVAVNIMEAELQEAMHAVAILSSVSQVISSSEEEFENDFELDMVLLDQAEWKAFVGSEVGLERSERSWVRALTKSRALSEPRPEQGGLVAASVAMPLRRVVQALKGRVLATKLREARQSSAPVL